MLGQVKMVICLDQNCFITKIPKFVLTHNSLDITLFWTNILFSTNIFLDPKLFSTKDLFEPKLFCNTTFFLT